MNKADNRSNTLFLAAMLILQIVIAVITFASVFMLANNISSHTGDMLKQQAMSISKDKLQDRVDHVINFIEHANKLGVKLRRVFVSLLGSEGLFLAVMMLFNGVLSTDYFLTKLQFITPFTDYVLIPWSGLLLGMYLMRENRRGGLSVWALALLVLWLAVPFSMRFGTDYFTMYSTYGYAICFFVFYASVMGRDAIGRERQLDIACAGVCLIAIVLGGTLLYCAWTGELLYA